MRLYGTLTSPYARITRIAVFEKQLQDSIEFVWTQTRVRNDPILTIHPSGRVPFLLLPNGIGIEDTPTIIDYLDTLKRPALFDHGREGEEWEYRRLESTARAMLDGLAVWAREIKRPPNEQSPEVILHEKERAYRLAAMFNELVKNRILCMPLNLAQLYLFAALDIERRVSDFTWREKNKDISGWQDKMANYPSIKASFPPSTI